MKFLLYAADIYTKLTNPRNVSFTNLRVKAIYVFKCFALFMDWNRRIAFRIVDIVISGIWSIPGHILAPLNQATTLIKKIPGNIKQ